MHSGCPTCDKPALRLLKHWSLGASLDYWCCDACGHVFAATKNDGDAVPRARERTQLPAPPMLRVKPDRRRAS